MKTSSMLSALLLFAAPCLRAGPPEPSAPALPAAASKKIDEILAAKEQAMARPGMRSRKQGDPESVGYLGKRADSLADGLGLVLARAGISPADLAPRARSDIRFRIALWALDRAKRKPEYERFAEYYVNRPSDTAAYLARKRNPELRGIPPGQVRFHLPLGGAWHPDPVDAEDCLEANRPILEYCYFMPPSGSAFPQDDYRLNIVLALRKLGSLGESFVVFAADARIALQAAGKRKLAEFPGRNGFSFVALCNLATPESFSFLAENRATPLAWRKTESFFRIFWREGEWQCFGRYPETLRHWEAWQALARRPWKKQCEKDFAEWILSVPAPKDPYPPKPKGKARKP